MAVVPVEIALDELGKTKTLLEETFYVLKKKSCVFRVKLTQLGLNLIKQNGNQIKTQIISIKDIVGCRCLRSKKAVNSCVCRSLSQHSLQVVEEKSDEHDATDISAYLYIYAYMLRNNRNKRERTTITLRFRSFDKYEDNYKEAVRWRTVLKRLICGEQVSSASVTNLKANQIKDNRRLLVLVNPKSGAGHSRILFQKKVAPVLQEAEVAYDLHITKHANYARDFIRTSNLYQWTGIVVVGGDGLLYEVVNGLFERWDWQEAATKLPIGIVPGGSGNGLARSIANDCREPYGCPALIAALAAAHCHSLPMDVVRVENASQTMFSALSVGWGLLSDIDIESERLRVLGGQRFAVWSLARVVSLKTYTGKVWYLPAKTAHHDGGDINSQAHARNAGVVELPAEVHLEQTQTGRQRVDSWYSAASKRSTYFSTTDSSYQSTADEADVGVMRSRMYGPASQIPSLTTAPPTTWTCRSGQFVLVHASYPSHISADVHITPQARLNDGLIWLLIMHASATRAEILKFLLGLSSGAHADAVVEGGAVEMIPVWAFRIEPDAGETGYITVDGEHVEYGPIQAEVFPGLIEIMVP